MGHIDIYVNAKINIDSW